MSDSIMKKPKNKFILAVIWIIALIIVSQVYIAFSNTNTDTNSYVTLVEGKGTLNESFLETEKKYLLSVGDTIRVIWDSSLAVISWGDGSLTRLGGNTKIIIDKNEISRDYSTINISFQLIAGKTWSNIVSFIGKDSSFTQSFQGIEAGVRGTIFDVDLEKEYIHVSDHQVELTLESWEEIVITEGSAFDISSFSLIEIEKFLRDIQDATWAELNERFDAAYLGMLKQALGQSLKESNPLTYILPLLSSKQQLLHALARADNYSEIQELLDTIPNQDRQETYTAVMTKYQNINFVKARDYEFYKRKIFYKKALIALWESQDTEILVRSSVYDLQDIFDAGNVEAAKETLSFLGQHRDILPEIDSSFLGEWFKNLPTKAREEFQASLSGFEWILDIDFWSVTNIDLGDLKNSATESLQSIDQGVQKFIGDKAENLIDQFSR